MLDAEIQWSNMSSSEPFAQEAPHEAGMNVIFDFLQQKLCIRAPTLSLFMRYIVSVVSILFTIGLMMICDVFCKNTCWYFLYHSRTCSAISRFWLGWLYIYDLVVHNSLNLSLPYCSCYSSALLHFSEHFAWQKQAFTSDSCHYSSLVFECSWYPVSLNLFIV